MIGCFVMEAVIGSSCRKPQEKRGIFAIFGNLSENHTSEIARRSIESNTSLSLTQRANDDAKQKARKAAHGVLTMAYVSQDDKAAVSPAIKAVLKKHGVKGTIGIRHHSTLFVNLSSGAIDFGCDRMEVNHHCIEESERYSPEAKSFLVELVDAMKSNGWFDKSDSMTDYFHVAFYISINVGKWNKPYICTAPVAC